MSSLGGMWHDARREEALRKAPAQPVTRIPPTPVRVRAITADAIAHAPGFVLIEWQRYGDWHVRWEPVGQVRRLNQDTP